MRRVLALAAVAALSSIPAAGGEPRVDYAAVALNVLPPGQSGDLLFPPTAKDQLRLYDGLTPRGANVKPQDLTHYFKSERFGVTGKVVRTERPRPGLRILRDRWDVPHIYGRTRQDVEFGAGSARCARRSRHRSVRARVLRTTVRLVRGGRRAPRTGTRPAPLGRLQGSAAVRRRAQLRRGHQRLLPASQPGAATLDDDRRGRSRRAPRREPRRRRRRRSAAIDVPGCPEEPLWHRSSAIPLEPARTAAI